MNTQLRHGFLAYFLFLLLGACAVESDRVAGGSGTEAGEAQGFLLDSSGRPLAGRQVVVFYQARAMEPTLALDTILTDSVGAYRHFGPAGFYRFQTATASLEAISSSAILVQDTVVVMEPLRLSPPRDIQGKVRSLQGSFPSTLRLEGVPYPCAWKDTTTSVRSFSCKGLPRGTYDILGDRTWLGTFDVDSSASPSVVGTFDFTPRIVPIETWPEVGSTTPEARRHDLWGLTRSGGWSVNSDGTSSLFPARTNLLEYYIRLDTASGRSHLKMTYDLDTNLAYPWVQANLNLGSRFYDLSSLDSLCFVHRGDSKVRIALTRYGTGTNIESRLEIPSVGDTWTRSCLALEDWNSKGKGSTIPFADLVRSMNVIRFNPSGGTRWDLSTVELVGVDLPSIFP